MSAFKKGLILLCFNLASLFTFEKFAAAQGVDIQFDAQRGGNSTGTPARYIDNNKDKNKTQGSVLPVWKIHICVQLDDYKAEQKTDRAKNIRYAPPTITTMIDGMKNTVTLAKRLGNSSATFGAYGAGAGGPFIGEAAALTQGYGSCVYQNMKPAYAVGYFPREDLMYSTKCTATDGNNYGLRKICIAADNATNDKEETCQGGFAPICVRLQRCGGQPWEDRKGDCQYQENGRYFKYPVVPNTW